MRNDTEKDSKHGNRSMSERRMSTGEQIAYYQRCARLARLGLDTRHSPEFYDRQVLYFQTEG